MSKTKSAIDMRPNVCEPPPHANGKEWWTTPPVSAPHPSQLAYAVEFRNELKARYIALTSGPRFNGYGRQQTEMGGLIASVTSWIKKANVLAQEFEGVRVGLGTTDGLIIEAHRMIVGLMVRLGGYGALTESERVVKEALESAASSIKQQRSGRGGVTALRGVVRRAGGRT